MNDRLLSRCLFCALCIFSLHAAWAGDSITDTLVLGVSDSEKAHDFSGPDSETITGGIGESARRLLPRGNHDWQGGTVAFTLKVDPEKAGGINTVSTYVFWIHHEEEQGNWDWSGQRSLWDFIRTAQEAGLKVMVRMGPWCHGEARNGGHPDWVLKSGAKPRTKDPAYLTLVEPLFEEEAKQMKGLSVITIFCCGSKIFFCKTSAPIWPA